jgi:hypothetical protein
VNLEILNVTVELVHIISGHKEFDGKTEFFWHKKIDEVVARRVKLK